MFLMQMVYGSFFAVILDFQHVIGLDSSAAQSIGKLKRFLLKNYAVETLLFVTGNEDGRFRCTFNLSHAVGGGDPCDGA